MSIPAWKIKYEQRKKDRLCTKCGTELHDNDKTICMNCMKKQVGYVTEKRAMRKLLNLCPQCGSELFGDEKLCIVCKAYHAGKESERRNNNRDHVNDINRNYYQKTAEYRRKNGLCTKCGGERDGKYIMCSICRAKNTNKCREQREGKSKMKIWIEKGLCIRCGGVRKDGYKLCEKHYQDAVNASHSEKAVLARQSMNNGFRKIIFGKKGKLFN